MEIDEKLKGDYEGNIRCELCRKELKVGSLVDVIQTDMVMDTDGEDTLVQYGEGHVETVLCKTCSPKVKVTVEG
jgi:hypothetical protein